MLHRGMFVCEPCCSLAISTMQREGNACCWSMPLLLSTAQWHCYSGGGDTRTSSSPCGPTVCSRGILGYLTKVSAWSLFPGGLSGFKQNHENLCDNSLQLQECSDGGGGGSASAVPPVLPQSIPTTPDIENAELTPILPFLFLGNEHDAQDLEKMQRMNIGYIINVTTHLPLYHYEKGMFNYKRLPATDSNKQNLRQYFEEAFEFIGNYPCLEILLFVFLLLLFLPVITI